MTSRFFPFYTAGFRCNPFRVLTDDEWREAAVLPEVVRDAWTQGDHLQLMGEAGRGKSTTLNALVTYAERTDEVVRFEYLPLGVTVFQTDLTDGATVFCLDEAQRLTPGERERLLRLTRQHNLRLALGTHEDLIPLFTRTGLTLRTISLEAMGNSHFAATLNARLAYFALPGVPHATLAPEAISSLRRRFGTDLRSAERFLYDYFQTHVRKPDEITDLLL